MTHFDDSCFECHEGTISWIDHTLPIFPYEMREILDQWAIFARCKGIPPEQARVTPDEVRSMMILFHVWKKLFNFDTLYPLHHADMDCLLHIHHFDLLLELYFNHKFRNVAFHADYLD